MTGRRTTGQPRAGAAPDRRNLAAAAVAASLQSTCAGWVVIWSAWRQAFTAFAALAGAELVVIDETTVDRLLTRIGEVEMAVSIHATAHMSGPWAL